jgi:hypothetical protein
LYAPLLARCVHHHSHHILVAVHVSLTDVASPQSVWRAASRRRTRTRRADCRTAPPQARCGACTARRSRARRATQTSHRGRSQPTNMVSSVPRGQACVRMFTAYNVLQARHQQLAEFVDRREHRRKHLCASQSNALRARVRSLCACPASLIAMLRRPKSWSVLGLAITTPVCHFCTHTCQSLTSARGAHSPAAGDR